MIVAGAALTVVGFAAGKAAAQDNFTFTMTKTGGVEACVKTARGRVTVSPTFGLVEQMHVEVSGLPPNTDFALFIIQVPNSPFGLAWYMGDMLTDTNGVAVEDFVGRFSKSTFIVAPGVAPAPKAFPDNATKNPATPPVQLYHLGLWFNSPADAGKAGCGTGVTPFNSTHHAGVQILNTSNFPNKNGPLRNVIGG
jgi:hypothetical protein